LLTLNKEILMSNGISGVVAVADISGGERPWGGRSFIEKSDPDMLTLIKEAYRYLDKLDERLTVIEAWHKTGYSP
jgi:hypothetical protein